jgi:hypothetical protein
MEEEPKKISIKGQNNKYLMNKIIKPIVKKERVNPISLDLFDFNKQLELLLLLNENKTNYPHECKIMKKELDKKISSYKQQDILKKVFNNQEFISFNFIIQKLIDCNLKCFYCNCNMFILYEMVRENKQWTVDRINNDLGHNNNNIVIACLECNLKRRNKTKDSFLFTKQLKITREGIDENDI